MESISPQEVKTPSDLGFDPIKFSSYRNGQLEAAQKVADTAKPLFLTEAPTGIGKSLLSLTAHKLRKSPKAAYIVGTKQLQDQLEADFHLPVLKGRNNYPCLHFHKNFPDVTSEICRDYLGEEECIFDTDCPYNIARRQALSAPICILNYPLFLSEANFGRAFKKLDYLIMDEVDVVEDQLMNFVEVKIGPKLLEKIGMGPPEFKTKLESWLQWLPEVQNRVGKLMNELGDPNTMFWIQLRQYIQLKRVYRKIGMVIRNMDDGWVMENDEDDPKASIIFKPVKVAKYASHNLWDHTGSAMGMSATIMGGQAMAIELGLHSWDVETLEMESPFPVESRQVLYHPVANMTHKNKDTAYPKVAEAINKILKKHPQEKTLIHCVSYDLRNFLITNVGSSTHHIMFHDSKNRTEALQRFRDLKTPAVLISPSMDRGVDLPGDLCRVVIVAKIPYPNLKSPQVNKRLHAFSDGSLWYARRTARTLVQMTGRATRYVGDFSTSYILDEQFGHIVARNGSIFPKWWKAAVKEGAIE